MKNNLTDFNKFKQEKAIREADKTNLELLKKLVVQKYEDLEGADKFIYGQIKLLCHFPYAEKFTLAIVEFRGKLYLLNVAPGQVFEYLGEFNDIIKSYLGW